MNTTMFEGPVAKTLGGADISWIVCLIAISPIYYLIARRLRPAVMPAAQPAEVAAG